MVLGCKAVSYQSQFLVDVGLLVAVGRAYEKHFV